MLLFPAVNGEEYDEELNNVCSVYWEVNRLHLSTQLDPFKNTFNDANSIDIFDIIS